MANLRRSRIRRLFIANRGEIACRIIRAAREKGIATVACFSEPDSGGLHVRMAEEVAYLGPAESARSYLNPEIVLNAALKMKCNAIHPGYGFLSENPDFAEMCRRRRIIFVGPSAKNIRDMGDKTIAKRLASEAGIPVIPGSAGALKSPDEARELSPEASYTRS